MQAGTAGALLLNQAIPCPAFDAIDFIVGHGTLLATDDADAILALALHALVAVLNPFGEGVAVQTALLIIFHDL